MWTIIKIDLKRFNIFKDDLSIKIGHDIKFFVPTYLIEKNKNRKVVQIKKNLFDDYIFCYSEKFKVKGYLERLKYLKGLKYFLRCNRYDQKNIQEIINRCKKYENEFGYIDQKYFYDYLNEKIEIFQGPLRNMVFNILEKNEKNISFLFGNFKAKISNKFV